MNTQITVIAATNRGRRLAARLGDHLDAHVAEQSPKPALRHAWSNSNALVMVMASGAAVRLIAPYLESKKTDPGVVCVDDEGRHVVSLLGGHEGGANELARRIADHLSTTPVITTASEQVDLPDLGRLGERFGCRVEGDVAAVGAHVVDGGAVHVVRDLEWPTGNLPYRVSDDSTCPQIRISDRLSDTTVPTVWLRPQSLVLGVGSSRGVSAAEVGELIDTTLAQANLSPASVSEIATVTAKSDEDGILTAAAERGWPVRCHTPEELKAQDVPHPSTVVENAVGTPSVSEAAALCHGDELIVPKQRSAMATVAVARRLPRGRLAMVSLGPGSDDLTTPRAQEELAQAEIVVGYGAYLDAAKRWIRQGTRVERFALGEEEKRARFAVEAARSGAAVAMVGSGDVGVYAMASPTLEIAGADIEVVVVPGVTASLAAAGVLGAPFGHDHCHISLSDLLTPWELIERRVRSAAEGDFALAFYNPRSRGRRWQLERARHILLEHRSPDTPVGIVSDAERPDQEVVHTTLADMDVDSVHMTTVVLVGNSRTRHSAGRMVTPRGYRESHER
ncbi:precorrin-3B C(17)-methyltransferase [Haloglycomyces albus]|uniref:precorrin-3B C(17)-methyltransferase n=1 Tax=Haloglycomyces albus TaxID=526067 RepID=UPI00046D58F9|nr:precorrin-3B C(17)-methyltransferase [Haloglycomyces albus]